MRIVARERSSAVAIGRQLAEQMNGGLRLLDTMSGGCFVLSLEAAIDP
jgi:hypothetical protein